MQTVLNYTFSIDQK